MWTLSSGVPLRNIFNTCITIFWEENIDGGKEEMLPTPTENICADVSQNVEESNENKELANYEASPCNNSEESDKLTSENVLQDNHITSVQTEEINSPNYC
jgi:hypothetical protein